MLNSRSLVLIIFAAWSALCWRWYVCGIKQACDKDKNLATQELVQTPAIEPDTVVEDLTAQPSNTYSNNASNAASKKKPFSANEIDKVQFEEVSDRMLIHFPYNSVRKEDNDAIDDYLTQLAQQVISTGETISITGHTDFVGSAKFNTRFGERRANSIRDILVKKGVPKAKIKCKSSGDRKPVATNDTAQGRYLNRRAEIKVGK